MTTEDAEKIITRWDQLITQHNALLDERKRQAEIQEVEYAEYIKQKQNEFERYKKKMTWRLWIFWLIGCCLIGCGALIQWLRT